MAEKTQIGSLTEPERRSLALAPTIRAKIEGDASVGTLAGYSARYDDPIFIDTWFGQYEEVISPGAFTRTLRENEDIRALYNHDTNGVLGRTKSGTLRLSEDSIGLAFEVDLPDTTLGRDVREMIRRGDISGCSFGFYVIEEKITERKGKPLLRTITDIELIEISPAVAFPANPNTEVSLRSRSMRRRSSPAAEFAYRARQIQTEEDDL